MEWLAGVRDLGLLGVFAAMMGWLGYWLPRWVDQVAALKKMGMELQAAEHQRDQTVRQENVRLWTESTERTFAALREEQRFLRDHWTAQHREMMAMMSTFCRYQAPPTTPPE